MRVSLDDALRLRLPMARGAEGTPVVARLGRYGVQLAAAGGLVGAGTQAIDLALLTNGLRSKRELGNTIDVAHRYFATGRRSLIPAGRWCRKRDRES